MPVAGGAIGVVAAGAAFVGGAVVGRRRSDVPMLVMTEVPTTALLVCAQVGRRGPGRLEREDHHDENEHEAAHGGGV